jgi:hypothetical protein
MALASCGNRVSSSRGGDDDSAGPDDDSSPAGDDDTTPAGDDDTTPSGDDDSTPVGDDDATQAGDDDSTASGDDDSTPSGDDDSTPSGDDDTTPVGDDDTTPAGTDAVWGDVIVSELLPDPLQSLDASGEWLELHSLVSWPQDLSGWVLADQGSDSVVLSPGAPLTLPAEGYLVLGVTTDLVNNGGAPVAYGYGTAWHLANASDEVVLSDADGTVIWTLIYPGAGGWPDSPGASSMLSMDAMSATGANDFTNWCVTPEGFVFGLGDRGTPGSANPTCP